MKSSDRKRRSEQEPPEKNPAWESHYFTADASSSDVSDSADIFDDDLGTIEPMTVPGYDHLRYIPFGPDDLLPYHLLREIRRDEVLSQNLFFNVLTLYGTGVEYRDIETDRPTADSDIREFAMRNSLRHFFLEQCTDLKHFFFAVAVVILNRAGDRIVSVRHKEACHVRFEPAGRDGNIHRCFVANFRRRSRLTRKDIETLTVLDERDPLGHLRILMGIGYGRDGLKKERTRERKFAVVLRFPTPGNRYYPSPYYTSIFRGDWLDIKRLISKGKKAKIRNQGAVKYHIEIHREYWDRLFESEGIFDPLEKKKRKRRELENIKKFALGVDNAGKTWISSYYTDNYGKEQRMIRINLVDTSKEGGDWAEDTQEASNMICYGTNIHPNLVGAVPGKAAANNSGSDKRELFTLKQSLEASFRDLLLKFHELVIHFNGWADHVVPVVPMILLTTLDKHTDAEKTTNRENKSESAN